MSSNLLKIRMGKSTLIAVPAVHYRAAFAEHVHLICANKKTCPNAIAVELGASAVLAISTWLKELGVRPLSKTKLPCMLGLIRNREQINTNDERVAANRLQEARRSQLPDLSPTLRRKSLEFSPISLLCLSATDSIIEAIRCAIELDIPVYGVDIEDFAHVDRQAVMIQDPIEAQDNLYQYVELNGKYSEACRVKLIDTPREVAMAARLKGLLSQYPNVLFTGGLAHWRNIVTHFQDNTLSPAYDIPEFLDISYKRVLVHPLIATQQMDIIPNVTSQYEINRSCIPSNNSDAKNINFDELFNNHLQIAYRQYFSNGIAKQHIDDYQGIKQFEGFLTNLGRLRLERIPNMFTTLEASEAMMSPDFYAHLSNILMDYKLGWAKPEDWPMLPVIAPAPLNPVEGTWLGVGQKAELLIPKKELDDGYIRSDPFYLSTEQEHDGRYVRVKNPWVWNDEPTIDNGRPPSWRSRVWPPCDNRLFTLAFQAAEVANNSLHERRVNLFTGSLQEGVDIKATLRSVARGENRLYIKEMSRYFSKYSANHSID